MRRFLPVKPPTQLIGAVGYWLMWWLIAALLFGQSFGALHRVVHLPAGEAVWGARATPQPSAKPVAPAEHSTLAHWFGSHSANDCALIDHVLQPSPTSATAPPPAPVLVAAAPPLAPVGVMPAGRASFFRARAPPLLLARTPSL